MHSMQNGALHSENKKTASERKAVFCCPHVSVQADVALEGILINEYAANARRLAGRSMRSLGVLYDERRLGAFDALELCHVAGGRFEKVLDLVRCLFVAFSFAKVCYKHGRRFEYIIPFHRLSTPLCSIWFDKE